MPIPEEKTTSLFGQGLVDSGLITEKDLGKALTDQSRAKQRVGERAVSLGLMTDDQLAKFLSLFFNISLYRLDSNDELDPQVIELIPEAMARRYAMIAVKREGQVLTLAMADPLDVRAVDAVRLETRCRVRKMVSSRSAILKAIDQHYHTPTQLAKSMDQLLAVEPEFTLPEGTTAGMSEGLERLKVEASDVPVVQFVNLVLMRAIQERASDIHIEPQEKCVQVRLRIDGQLRETSAPPLQMYQAIATRIKLLSNLDISERRLPQDGRFKFKVFDKAIDVRVSCLPTIYGEKVVMRILDRSSLIVSMKELGFESFMQDAFEKALHLPHGLVIITGPTGSGKTTTLYAALQSIRTPTKNIVTVEDPVEYQIEKINQVQTKSDIGLTFAAGLRSILRQDPDIVMVGEIRDRETAEICIRASLTGHLVLSTLHTNDAVSAVTRLIDMQVEPYLLAATLNLVMAQRLLRRICENCSEPWQPSSELIQRLKTIDGNGEDQWKFRHGKGCSRCGGLGYKGRVAVYEQFIVSDEMKRLISIGSSLDTLKEAAKKAGIRSLLQNSLLKAKQGVTTLEEAFSVCATQGGMDV